MNQQAYESYIYLLSDGLRRGIDIDIPENQYSPILTKPLKEARELNLSTDIDELKDFFSPEYYEQIAKVYS